MPRIRPSLAGPIAVLCLCPLAWGQARTTAQQNPATPVPAVSDVPNTLQPDLAAPEVSDSYTVGVDDLLSVFVFQMPELTSQVRVDAKGAIRLPMLDAPVPALGLTAIQLAHAIAQAYSGAGIAHDPHVQVIVRQVMSRPIVVMGAVKYPAVFEATRPMYLAEVLARAGGLEAQSGTTLTLTRQSANGPVTRQIDLAKLQDSNDAAADPLLTGGEVVRVLPARLFYVVGALEKPGAFPLQTGEPMSALKALALAQGFSVSAPADRKHAEIIRTAADGVRHELPVNLDQILKHKAPDLPLQAGDILYVPENGTHKVMGLALSDAAQAAVIAFGYNAGAIF